MVLAVGFATLKVWEFPAQILIAELPKMEGVLGIGLTVKATGWLTDEVQPPEMALTEYEPGEFMVTEVPFWLLLHLYVVLA